MKTIKINEKITMRGLNNLFYQIEVYNIDENNKLKLFAVYPYMRKYAKILHETSVFKLFEDNNNEKWEDKQCLKYCKILEKTINMIEEIEN